MLQEISISRGAFLLIATVILFVTKLHAARLPAPTMTTSELDVAAAYAARPNEVLPIQPVLLYPAQQARELKYQARNFNDDEDDDNNNDDDEIIYVKLLKPRSYRPHKYIGERAQDAASRVNANAAAHKELSMKDIFYVKALANGQFSQRRLKWYRLPEFYAISVFHKADQYEAQNLV